MAERQQISHRVYNIWRCRQTAVKNMTTCYAKLIAESEIVLSTDSELDTDYYRCSENLIEFAANLLLNC